MKRQRWVSNCICLTAVTVLITALLLILIFSMHPSVKLFLHKQLLISYTVAQSFVFFEHDDVLYYLQLDYPVSDFSSLNFSHFVPISALKKSFKGKFSFFVQC